MTSCDTCGRRRTVHRQYRTVERLATNTHEQVCSACHVATPTAVLTDAEMPKRRTPPRRATTAAALPLEAMAGLVIELSPIIDPALETVRAYCPECEGADDLYRPLVLRSSGGKLLITCEACGAHHEH